MRRWLVLLFALLSLAVLLPAASAQSEPQVIATVFQGPRVQFSPDGRLLALYEDSSMAYAMETAPAPETTVIQLIDAATGEAGLTLEGARDFATGLLFSPDGARLYAMLANGDLVTWDTASGELPASVRTPIFATRTPLFWHPETGELIAAVSSQTHTTYFALDPETGAMTVVLINPPFTTYTEFATLLDGSSRMMFNDLVAVPFRQSEATAALPLAGDEVWTVNPQGRVGLLSLGTGEIQVLIEGGEQPMLGILDLTVTDGGGVAFVDDIADTLTLVDVVNQTIVEFPVRHRSAVVAPNALQFAQYDEDGTALILTSVADGSTATLPVPEGEMFRPNMRLRYSPDSALLAATGPTSADGSGSVVLYRLDG